MDLNNFIFVALAVCLTMLLVFPHCKSYALRGQWCRTKPFNMSVDIPDCQRKIVPNNFCYGQCLSYYLPGTSNIMAGLPTMQCRVCAPVHVQWKKVLLNCPRQAENKFKVKRIQVLSLCERIYKFLVLSYIISRKFHVSYFTNKTVKRSRTVRIEPPAMSNLIFGSPSCR